MVGGRRKRGSGGFLAAFMNAKDKKEREQSEERKGEEKEADEEGKGTTADQIFEDVYSNATTTDILSEYTFFLQHLPTLLDNARADLIEQVEQDLRIKDLKEKMCETADHRKLNYEGDSYPILEALSLKLGLSLTRIIAPPTVMCLLCDKPLQRKHKPAMVPLHTLEGPELASKFQWECKSCRATYKFRKKIENNTRVYYNVDTWGNPEMGYKFRVAKSV